MRRIRNVLDTLCKMRVKPKATTQISSVSKKLSKNFQGDNKTTTYNKQAAMKPLGNKVIWHNLRHVQRYCEDQKQPPPTVSATTTIQETNAKGNVDASLIDVLEVQRFVSDVFAAMQVPFEAASEMADALIAADYMGDRSMGIHRLPSIVDDLLNLRVDPRMQPKVLCEREALALVDGQNAPGPVVANFCMDLAMTKARNQTIGLVAARRSNNIGMASWYACQALSQRLLGICITNGCPILAPSCSEEPLMGGCANSIEFAAASREHQLLMNVGMSGLSEQLTFDCCNGHLQQLPAAALLPFSPHYKGFGLAAMVETLCGVMTGARYATQLELGLGLKHGGLFSAGRDQDQDIADLGQVYIAIDPMRFSISFEDRLSDFQQLLRNVLPCDANQPPLIPGEKESQHMQMVDDQGGLTLSPCTLNVIQELGERFNLKPIGVRKSVEDVLVK